MEMPISEVIDRYTITKLKAERTDEDVSEELKSYAAAISKYGKAEDLTSYIGDLYVANGKIWETESDIRKGTDLPLEEIGRLALRVRDLNCERNSIKAKLVDKFAEGFKEIKVNYVKRDYGQKEKVDCRT